MIEDPDSQNRRRKSDGEIKLRLMTLDYVLLHLADNLLDSPETKAEFFAKILASRRKTCRSAGATRGNPLPTGYSFAGDKEQKVPRFVFIDEGMRSLARFEKSSPTTGRSFEN